jgi:uncharacterized protein
MDIFPRSIHFKMYLGNRGAFKTIRPQFVRLVVDAVRKAPAKPFVTDSVRVPGYEYKEAEATGLGTSDYELVKLG